MSYNGHKNWTHWNVSLWLFNDEGLYRMMQSCVRHADTLDEAAADILRELSRDGMDKTPDGARYSFTAIRAALTGWED